MTWLSEPHNAIFTIAFTVMICFALLEALSMLLGLGISEWLGKMLPGTDLDADAHVHVHADVPDAHAEVATDASGDLACDHPGDVSHGHGGVGESGWVSGFLSWLEVGRVPVLISLNVFLAAFSVTGFLLQGALQTLHLPALPGWLAAVPAFFVALPVLKVSHRILGRIWPGDESSAFPPEALIGRIGVVTIGTATAEKSAEVKVVGPDGRYHYVMVFASADPLSSGSEVQLISRIAGTSSFRGLPNANPNLSPRNYT